jgi:DNA polymerase IV
MGSKRIIMHVDMDAFFASVEQLDHPEYRGRPVIVGGLSGRGVVSTCSYEARKFGVHSAMPMATARRLCPQAVYVQGRYPRYVELSRQIRSIFHTFSPVVEPLSIDEAFLDLTGMEALVGDATTLGEKIKQVIRQQTGLTASVGIAPQ